MSAVSAGNGTTATSRSPTAPWPARPSSGGDAALWVGVALSLAALGVLGTAALTDPGAPLVGLAALSAVLVLCGAALVAWGLAYRRLEYTLSENALEVRWLGRTVVVPYAAIDGIYTGQRLVGHTSPRLPGWPGIYVGPGRARGIGRLRFFATSPDPAALTLVTLEHSGLVLSARAPQEFRTALIERVQALAEDAPVASATDRTLAVAPWSALSDRWLWVALTGGIVLLLVVVTLAALGLPSLGEQIPLHFDASGQPSVVGPKGALLRLPLLGFLLLLVDVGLGMWAHARDRLLGRVLWIGGAVLQAVLIVAVIRLLQ